MTTITVNLDDNKAKLLENKAREYGLSGDKLVATSIDDLVNQADSDFERAMQRVISGESGSHLLFVFIDCKRGRNGG